MATETRERQPFPIEEDQQVEFLERYISPVVRNPLVLWAFGQVDRRLFVPPQFESQAYQDETIQLGEGSSISEPTVVALMTDCLGLTGRETALEVGTASGYQAAILAYCALEVFTVEYNPRLAQEAEQRFESLGYNNIYVRCSDGALGWPGETFDAIVVTAGVREIPRALIEQLKEGGCLVAPVGKDLQNLRLTTALKVDGKLLMHTVALVSFHPLISPEHGGWTQEALDLAQKVKIQFVRQLVQEAAIDEGITEDEILKRLIQQIGLPLSPEQALEMTANRASIPEELFTAAGV